MSNQLKENPSGSTSSSSSPPPPPSSSLVNRDKPNSGFCHKLTLINTNHSANDQNDHNHHNHHNETRKLSRPTSDSNPLVIYVVPPEDVDSVSRDDYLRGATDNRHHLKGHQHRLHQHTISNSSAGRVGNRKNDMNKIVVAANQDDNNNNNITYEHDTVSLATSTTTTSEVNSDDDAASIVSRLSMIVSEQELQDRKLTRHRPPPIDLSSSIAPTAPPVKPSIPARPRSRTLDLCHHATGDDQAIGGPSSKVAPNDNMLSITRSTWTLSEFDRIFPRMTSKERKKSLDFGGNSGQVNCFNFSVNYEPKAITQNAMAIGMEQADDDRLGRVIRSGTESSQDTHVSQTCCPRPDNQWAKSYLVQYFPPADWLASYQWGKQLWGDIMAGLVVATLNISLCLSASLLADVDSGVGFRTSIVNCLIYALFCTSKHTSFGAYSIMALMASVTVQKAMDDEMVMMRLELGPSASMSRDEYELWRYKIIIFYTLLVGLVQLIAGLLGLGTIFASFIPEALCSSMIASTAITMAIGQLANMCGLNYKQLFEQQTGDSSQIMGTTFKWLHQLLLLFDNIATINYTCLTLSLVSLVLLFLNQFVIQQKLERMFNRRIMIPFELLLLVLSILLSYFMQLEQVYAVETSGPVTLTFDLPTWPDLRLLQELWLDALTAGLISFTLTYTLAKLLANKLNYELDSNQELIACGLGNIMGGLFDALPASGSSIRSSTQLEMGGASQFASVVNCAVLLLLAHTCGQLIAPLPRCVMAAILCYGFIRMMTQMADVLKYWRLCKVDFSIWIVGFVAILSVDLVYGFVVSFIYSILTILYRAQNRRAYLLGSIDSSDVYVPIKKYPAARKIDGIEIYQYCGSLHYACADLFEQKLRHHTGVNAKQIKRLIQTLNGKTPENHAKIIADKHSRHKELNIPTHIILDFSMISFVDSSGVFTIKKIIEEYHSVNIIVLFASLATHVAATVKNESTLWENYHSRFYVTLSDAVHNAIRQRNLALV